MSSSLHRNTAALTKMETSMGRLAFWCYAVAIACRSFGWPVHPRSGFPLCMQTLFGQPENRREHHLTNSYWQEPSWRVLFDFLQVQIELSGKIHVSVYWMYQKFWCERGEPICCAATLEQNGRPRMALTNAFYRRLSVLYTLNITTVSTTLCSD